MRFRLLLFPFTLLYSAITGIRNFLYDHKIFSATHFDLPVINVGNLRVGGTGKTPQIEYLIRLLQKDEKIAVVSRGYKRKTKGFLVADKNVTPALIGDEPYQMYKKFKDIIVAVGEDRVPAVRKVLDKFSPSVVLLDDAFQHRKIQAGFNILLSPYHQPFYQDFVLPAGNLREARNNAKRADIVVVSKSPAELTEADKTTIKQQIRKYTQAPVFFSCIQYDDMIFNDKNKIPLEHLRTFEILLVTGIANPKPLFAFLSKKNINFESLKFGDHHNFSKTDVQLINDKLKQLKGEQKIILTTEKDYVRLKPLLDKDLYYLPIQTKIMEEEKFNTKIIDYVRDYK